MSTAVINEFTRLARVEIKMTRDCLARCDPQREGAMIPKHEARIALLTSRLLCPHTYIEHKRLRVHGLTKHAFKCNACAAYALFKDPI